MHIIEINCLGQNVKAAGYVIISKVCPQLCSKRHIFFSFPVYISFNNLCANIVYFQAVRSLQDYTCSFSSSTSNPELPNNDVPCINSAGINPSIPSSAGSLTKAIQPGRKKNASLHKQTVTRACTSAHGIVKGQVCCLDMLYYSNYFLWFLLLKHYLWVLLSPDLPSKDCQFLSY